MLLLFRNPVQNGDGVASAAALAAGNGLAVRPGSGSVAAAAAASGAGFAILPGNGVVSAIVVLVGDGALIALPITYYWQSETEDGRVYQGGQTGTGSSYRHEPAVRRLTP